MDDIVIEPLSEAFGQNLETVNVNASKPSSEKLDSSTKDTHQVDKKSMSAPLILPSDVASSQTDYTLKTSAIDEHSPKSRMLSIINKLNGKEAIDDMETIVAREVEQGRCASFKRTETVNEKRSINEPKYIPVSMEASVTLIDYHKLLK